MSELRGFKFVKSLASEFKKVESDDETKYSNFYTNSKTETVIVENGIDDVFESTYINITSAIGLGGIINSVIDCIINISKYIFLVGSIISNY